MKEVFYKLLLVSILFNYPCAFKAKAQNNLFYQGKVIEKESREPIIMANVLILELNRWQITDENGYFSFSNIPQGNYTFIVNILGYTSIEQRLELLSNTNSALFKLEKLSLQIEEIVVNGEEANLGSSTKINQSAIQHIQPKSLKDIIDLVPGHLSSNPTLAKPLQVSIRDLDIGNTDPNSAFGAAIYVDGAPISNNANMQVFSTSMDGLNLHTPTVAGKGIDLRSISGENIESVEVIRGIPSVEYSDLSSGAVIIKSKIGTTPLRIRATSDLNTKTLSAGKGIGLKSKTGVFNLNVDYAQAYPDIKKKYKGYKRINTQVGYSSSIFDKNKPLTFNIKLDYQTTIDNEKTDPQFTTEEMYNSEYQRFRTNIFGKWQLNSKLITNIEYNFSGNYSHQKDHYKKIISSDIFPLASSLVEGEHEAEYLPSNYLSDTRIDGKPFSLLAKLKVSKSVKSEHLFNKILLGYEWRMEGNNGLGRVYDINRPPKVSTSTYFSTIRPRSLKEIPNINNYSLYIEDKLNLQIGKTKLITQAGLRYNYLKASKTNYYSWEPRVNLKYSVYNNNKTFLQHLGFRFGYGIATKLPGLIHLFPDKAYFDKLSFNHYNEVDPSTSLAVYKTQIINNTNNPKLTPFSNIKREAGIDFKIKGIDAKITAYSEKQTGGISFNSIPLIISHNKYTNLEGAQNPYLTDDGVYYTLNGENTKAPIVIDTTFNLYKVPQNDRVLIKKGIEYFIDLGKLNFINTQFILNGAWMNIESYNTQNKYNFESDLHNGKPYPYLPVFPAGEKTERHRFNTNIQAVTYIPAVRLIATLTTQIVWFEKYQNKWEDNKDNPYVYVVEDGKIIEVDNVYSYVNYTTKVTKNINPIGYYGKDGKYYNWNVNPNDEPYRKMVETKPQGIYIEESYPVRFQFNFKLTKEIGDHLKLAFMANNFLNTRPKYQYKRYNGYTLLNQQLYFGAELVLEL
ncbi:TonB-dependent receptor [Labilibacter marinus]|uniref:TonB-dependent receptor n=1 Tax=Labilibacter marinus TaxID=1477105 RepID=UPI0013017836|nr:TonB-dependent receptor [Labilibacter marinus]